jgi:hypothetical protein
MRAQVSAWIICVGVASTGVAGRVPLATGAAAAVAGGVLWLTAPSERGAQAARLVPMVDGASAGVAVVGRF